VPNSQSVISRGNGLAADSVALYSKFGLYRDQPSGK
jgi:hypothetical protein